VANTRTGPTRGWNSDGSLPMHLDPPTVNDHDSPARSVTRFLLWLTMKDHRSGTAISRETVSLDALAKHFTSREVGGRHVQRWDRSAGESTTNAAGAGSNRRGRAQLATTRRGSTLWQGYRAATDGLAETTGLTETASPSSSG